MTLFTVRSRAAIRLQRVEAECTSSLLRYLCNIWSAHISVDIIARSQYRVISRSQAVAVVVILAMFAILRAKCENPRQTG